MAKEPKRTATFAFEGDFEGIEVKCRLDVPIDLFLSFMEADSSNAEVVRGAYRRFGDEVLIEWNLEDDDDQPIPANGDTLLERTPRFASLLLTHWREAAAEISAPLGQRSTNGARSPAPSIPMASL